MKSLVFTLVVLVFFACGNNKQPTPAVNSTPSSVYTQPAPTYSPPSTKSSLSPVFEQNYNQNQFRRNNNYNQSSDDRYYCENCGEVIYDTDESEEYCEDCLYEITEQQERRERAQEYGDYDEDYEEY